MPSAIRSMAWEFISKGVKMGLNATEIIDKLDLAKLTYRRTDMLADIRSLANLPQKLIGFKNVRLDLMPSLNVMQIGGNFMSKLYRYDVNMRVLDENTGEETDVKRVVSSDVPLTRNQASNAVKQREEESTNYRARTVLSSSTVMGYYREDAIIT